MPDSPQFIRFRCPGCSGEMDYDPQSGMMKCQNCGTTQPAPDAPAVMTAHSLSDALRHSKSPAKDAAASSCSSLRKWRERAASVVP